MTDEVDDPTESNSERGLLAAIGYLLLLTGVLFSVIYLHLDAAGAAVTCFLASLYCLGLLVALKRSLSGRATSGHYVATLYLALTGVCVFTGGHDAPAVVWLAVVPMLAALLLGLRTSLAWVGTVAATYVTFYAMRLTGFELDPPFGPAVRDALYLVGNVTLVALVMGIVWKYDSAQRETRARLERQSTALRQARDVAEAASRSKSSFLANMSHEVRTPLNGVIGMVELLSCSRLVPHQREQVATIRTSAEALLSVLNDILDFSKIESGRITVEAVPCDLHGLVWEVADLFGPRADARGLELVCELEALSGRVVVTDPLRLRQVITNLMANAIKFTERGSVTVRARVVLEAPDPGAPSDTYAAIVIDVEDTGIGIARDRLESIFEAFAQEDGSTSRRYGGTGLGLSIARSLVQAVGGALTVESTTGAGSRFRIELRAAIEGGELVGPQLEPAGARWGEPPAEAREGEPTALVLATAASGSAIDRALTALGVRSVSAPSAAGLVIIGPRTTSETLVLLGRTLRSAAVRPLVVAMATPTGALAREIDTIGLAVDAWLPLPMRPSRLQRGLGELLAPGRILPLPPSTNPAPTGVDFGPGANLLVAEDHPINQRVIREMLARLGHRVTLVGDGRSAVNAASAHRYDLIFMDGEMPELDGSAAVREIRRLPGDAANVPVVALTAHALVGDRERYLEAGMDDHLAKPVSMERLAETIARWATKRLPAPETLSPPALAPNVSSADEDIETVYELTAPQTMRFLGDAVRLRDTQAVLAHARRLRAAAAWTGRRALVEACAGVERACKEGRPMAPSFVSACESFVALQVLRPRR